MIDGGVMAEFENGVDKSVTRKRLAKLQKEGYADYLMYEGRKMYYATARGLSAIGSWRKPYRGKSGTTWHAVCIGIVAAWMRQEYEVCIS